jgi:hypothetical protein
MESSEMQDLAARLYAEFVKSHGGEHPTAEEMRVAIQKKANIDVGGQQAMLLMLDGWKKYRANAWKE